MRALALLALTACSMGPAEETLLVELRVVGAVAEPPEVAPGEDTRLTTTIADPVGDGFDAMVWWCTPTGDGCVEDILPLDQRAAVWMEDDDTWTTTFTVPEALAAGIPDDETVLPATLWILACAPGVCPIVDDVAAALHTGADDALLAELADPVELMRGLPPTGVSLATRTVGVSTRPVEERNVNPQVSLLGPLPEVVEPEEALTVPLEVVDDGQTLVAFGFATAGGFGAPVFQVIAGAAEPVWYAPPDGGAVELFIVVEDGEGGSALWRGQARVADDADDAQPPSIRSHPLFRP